MKEHWTEELIRLRACVVESMSAVLTLHCVHLDSLRTLGAGLAPGGPAQAPTDDQQNQARPERKSSAPMSDREKRAGAEHQQYARDRDQEPED